jgi:hypothetical protein
MRCAAIEQEVNGRECIFVGIKRPQQGCVFIAYYPSNGATVIREVPASESITKQASPLIPEFILGILVGKLERND